MKKILITGGTGFVGRNLISILEKKYNLSILSRKESDKKEFVTGDLMNYDSLKNINNIDFVIHLAFSKNYPENILMAENLIRFSKERKVKKIILLSSMSATRKIPDNYGKIKREVENVIKESGLNYTILRPTMIYGKGSTSFNFIFYNMGKIPLFTPIIGSGKYIIMPVHVGDVVRSIEKCIVLKKTDRKAYDLPGGEKIYFVQLINLLKRSRNVKKMNVHLPIWFCKLISVFLSGTLSRENIINLTENSTASLEEAKTDFGYNPIKFSEGIKNGII